MEELINLFMNAGVSIAVIVYFMYRDFKFMNTLQTTLTSLVDAVDTLKMIIKDHKEEDIKNG